jgi:hypothetical protein
MFVIKITFYHLNNLAEEDEFYNYISNGDFILFTKLIKSRIPPNVFECIENEQDITNLNLYTGNSNKIDYNVVQK